MILFKSPSPTPPLKGGKIIKESPIKGGELWTVRAEKSEEENLLKYTAKD
jgi:hypothetical protein